jgi:unsaturated rhamnogalacturonyl hydrolase
MRIQVLNNKILTKYTIYMLIIACVFALNANAQTYSEKMSVTAMKLWPDSSATVKWAYEQGVFMKGIEEVWLQTGNPEYFNYIKNYLDNLIAEDGTIKGYKEEDYNIDNLLLGREVLMLYTKMGAQKYYKALQTLRHQLQTQPRTNEGGFWHKKRYPYQMWLDGLYMGEPFYAEYATVFHEEADFDDIANQFIYMENHARDTSTGLLYHGWDESKKERWSNPITGSSQNFWGRADGWYAMALVDVLDKMPVNNPKRKKLLAILNRLAFAIKKYQDKESGLWYQVLDKASEQGNYLEASASCMFVYALAKGVRKGYLPERFKQVATKGYDGIIKNFVETDANGQLNLNGTVSVAGLGGTPYRDGSYEYYLSEKLVQNDPKGVGSFIQASIEIELLGNPSYGKRKIALIESHSKDVKN